MESISSLCLKCIPMIVEIVLQLELLLEAEDSLEDSLVLDYDLETGEKVVSVNPKLVKKLKSHQINGVRFMWDTCFESVKQMERSKGGGCILAHCMGLGKTLQVYYHCNSNYIVTVALSYRNNALLHHYRLLH